MTPEQEKIINILGKQHKWLPIASNVYKTKGEYFLDLVPDNFASRSKDMLYISVGGEIWLAYSYFDPEYEILNCFQAKALIKKKLMFRKFK